MKQAGLILAAALVPLALSALAPTVKAQAPRPLTLSEPRERDNLTVYFVRGDDQVAEAPSTLDEALESGAVKLYETGDVNQLEIENLSDREVFVNAGDIVKGGRQDRVLSVSLVIPPKSGKMPIAAFCVEQGRWSQRGEEDSAAFASAKEMAPLKDIKLALRGVKALRAEQTAGLQAQSRQALGVGSVAGAQSEVWRSVADAQSKLSANIAAPVADSASPSSLQLALEHDGLTQAKKPYLEAIEGEGFRAPDYVGVVFAVNGKVSSAEIYSSNSLFRKMWPKLANAAAVEALSARAEWAEQKPPKAKVVERFLAAERGGEELSRELPADLTWVEKRDTALVYTETRRANGETLHRSYLAR